MPLRALGKTLSDSRIKEAHNLTNPIAIED
jgi:hypothetical protein